MAFSSVADGIVAVVPIGHNLRLELHICNDGVEPSPVVTTPAAISGTCLFICPLLCIVAPDVLCT
jgi:hypothetical protein